MPKKKLATRGRLAFKTPYSKGKAEKLPKKSNVRQVSLYIHCSGQPLKTVLRISSNLHVFFDLCVGIVINIYRIMSLPFPLFSLHI